MFQVNPHFIGSLLGVFLSSPISVTTLILHYLYTVQSLIEEATHTPRNFYLKFHFIQQSKNLIQKSQEQIPATQYLHFFSKNHNINLNRKPQPTQISHHNNNKSPKSTTNFKVFFNQTSINFNHT